MKDTKLDLKIISALKTIYNGKVASVRLPGTLGGFSIHPDHAPLISSLQAGTLIYDADGEQIAIEIQGGFVEVNQGVVTVCIA